MTGSGGFGFVIGSGTLVAIGVAVVGLLALVGWLVFRN